MIWFPARSEQCQLTAGKGWGLEQVRPELIVALVHFEAGGREAEPGGDLLRIGSGAALAYPPLRHVVLAAVHGPQDIDHAGGAVRELGRQPLAEQLLELQGQSQKDIPGVLRTGLPGGLEDALSLAISDCGNNGRNHNGYRYPRSR